MKKSTKILSLILSVLTLLSVFSVATPVFAAEVTSENIENIDAVTASEDIESEEQTESEIVSEIENMRTEHTKYFRMSDGSYMAAQYAQPVHYEENGEWKEYDYSITKNENTSENEFVIENSDNEMSFPEEFSEDDAQIEVSAREYDIKFSPVVDKKIFNNSEKTKGKVKNHKHLKSNEIIENFTEDAPIEESADKNSEKLKIDNQKSAIAYEEVYDNIDLEYEISSNQIKESIVLNSKQDKNKFEFTVDTDGLFPKKETDGSITLYEDKEYTKPVSSIMKPFMYDANGEYSYDVTMDIKEKKGTYILTVKADNNWLNDKSRKYPVVIDPTIVLDVGRAKTYDCYVDNSQASSAFPKDYYLYAGHSSLGKTRTFVKFDLPAIPDKCAVITNASIHFVQQSADVSSTEGYLNLYNVTSAWENNGTVTWNKQPTANKNLVLDYAKIVFGAGVQYSFDITKTVKSWYQGATNNGLMLASANESVVNRVQLFSAENNVADIYPQITVNYLNNKGIEDYWNYSSYANGAAGSAHINDYTGNLVYALPLLSSVSDLMPLDLVAYYNTYSANVKLNVGKSNSSRTTVAKGFRLNVQQTVLSSKLYGLSDEEAKEYPYVYTDGDGTEHYIKKTTEDGKTIYTAEDNENITLSLTPDIECSYQIKFKGGTSYYFNAKGNLGIMQDANGNRITINYKSANSTDGLEAKTRIAKITDGAGHTFTFTYYKDSNGKELDYIEKITDNAERTVHFKTTSGFLRTVTYMDKTKTNLYYQLESSEGLLDYVQDANGYGLNFDYTPKSQERKIKQVCEYINANGSNTVAQRVTFDRTQYNTTVVRSAGVDGQQGSTTTGVGADDIITTIQFDNSGKAISQQVSLGSNEEIGAGICSYTNDAKGVGEQNNISSNSSLGKNTVNLLKDSNGEVLTNWTSVINSGVNSKKGVSQNNYYVGQKSVYIKNESFDNSGVSYYRQTVNNADEKEYYTFSAYVKAGALTKSASTHSHTGAYLQITPYDNNNNQITGTVYSEKITAKTDTAVNNGWRRLSVTIKVPEGTKKLNVYLCLRDYIGTVYFDGMQLEKGNSANSYNMVENGSFENKSSNIPASWSGLGDLTLSANNSNSQYIKDGKLSLKIDGDALKSNGVGQSIYVSPNENDTYIVSGWANADAVNDTWHSNARFEILPRVYYTKTDSSGTETQVYQDKDPAVFNTTISGWQYSASSFSLKYTKPESGNTYTPVKILIVPRYSYQENTAYFDNIQLIKDAGQTHTYTYDKDGNVVLTAVNSEQKVNTKYDDDDNLTEYTDIAGYKTTATYDDNHNLLTTKSPRGVITKNSYHDNGMIETTEIQNSAGTASIKTTTDIDLYSNGALVFSTTDQHGYETIYGRDEETGVITDITTPNKVVTYKEYDNSFTKLKKVTTAGTSVNYTYNGNRLANIIYGGVDGRSETYGFVYDKFGNTTSVTVGGKPLSTKTYGTNNGPLKSSVYGNNDSVTYNYNNLGLQSSIVKTDVETGKSNVTSKYSWAYTSTGVTQSHTDTVNNRKFLYDYDSLGRLIRQEIQTNDTFSHVGSTEITYDMRNNVTKIANEFGGFTAIDEYIYSADSTIINSEEYAQDNLISRYKIAGTNTRYVDYTYDSLNRLNKRSLVIGTETISSDYSYYTAKVHNEGSDEKRFKTTQLAREILDNTAYTYYYDEVGNITDIKISTRNAVNTIDEHRKYTYDSKNQLSSETITKKDVNNNSVTTKTTFEYDDIGNIIKKTLSGEENKTITYNYGKDSNAGWNHILTSVDLDDDSEISENEKIKYDAIGNPTKYLGASLSWNGRELTSYTVEDDTNTTANETLKVTYTYDADGLRGTKTVNGTKSTYYYVSGLLRYEERGEKKLYYFYDASGNLSAIRYSPDGGTTFYMYYILTNSRGDVVGIYSGSGVLLASYEYDAWGKVVSVENSNGDDISTDEDHIANLNPIRYRGYYYDTETKLYYLQSRYYDPEVGRFINADGLVSTGQGVLGYNMFAYCGNNPVNRADPSGEKSFNSIKTNFENFIDSLFDWLDDDDIDDMKKSSNNAISSFGHGLGTAKKLQGAYGVGEKIEAHTNDGINMKAQIVNDIVEVGQNGVYLDKTPDALVFSNVSKYNEYCMNQYNTMYTNSCWDYFSNEEKNARIADLMICWDLKTTVRIGLVESWYSICDIAEECLS